jgi:hypothetical protein|tara:strand:+ start:233 stop:376 length:144 start_codon:yes stop_codon:yes gene_type:complete
MFIGIINWIPERAVPPGTSGPPTGFDDIITEAGVLMVSEDSAQLIIE